MARLCQLAIGLSPLTLITAVCLWRLGVGGGQWPSAAGPSPEPPTEAQLNECLGQPVAEVVQRLRLGGAEWHWTDEPPCTLRGASYSVGNRRVYLYIAEDEPLFRQFDIDREWDYGAFLQCRVGGIQYESGDVHFDIGPAVPWQWRRPK